MSRTIRQTRVEIDSETAATVFPARVVDGVTWNGWAVPSFAPDVAREIAAQQRAWQVDAPDSVTYDVFSVSDCGRYVTAVSFDGVEGRKHAAADAYVSVGENVEGLGLPIGEGWTWQELEDDAPHEPAALDAYLADRAAAAAAYCTTWNTALHAAYAAGSDAAGAVAAARAAVGR